MKLFTKFAVVAVVALALVAGAAGADAAFTRYLTVGSQGADVVELQTTLEAQGYLVMPAGVAKGYFGALTKNAVMKWQAAVGLPSTGYFGPMSIAKIMATGSTSAGQGQGSTQPANNNSGALKGGAGSVDSYEIVSNLSNEEVGEDEADVEVAGLDIEADEGSDIEITAVKLVFDEGTAGSDFEDYAEEVSVLLEGEEVARIDADEFTDDNDWTKTVSLDNGAIIEAGDTAELTVVVSGASNIDSDDQGDTWTVDFRQIRFEDADGATISEDPATDAVTFSFEGFASAADVELQVSLGDDDINDAGSVEVSDTDETDGVDILSFEVEIEGDSDVEVDDLSVDFTSVGAGVGEIINNAELVIDGDVVGSESVSSTTATSRTITFDDLGLTFEAGETVEVIVRVDVNDLDGAFGAGDTLAADVNPDDAAWDAEDESGEDLVAADKTGSAASETQVFYQNGIEVAFNSATKATEYTVDSTDNDYVKLTLVFDVTAFGDDIYIPNVATDVSSSTGADGSAPTTAQGVGYHVQFTSNGIASTSVSETLTSTAEEETNSFLVEEGETERFTLEVTVSSNGAATDGDQFRAILTGINFATTDTATGEFVFTSNLEDDFKTGYARIAD